MDEILDDMIVPTDWTAENSIIKVIGVGGGGCNAVNYMYNQKVQGCCFIVCNTDAQALGRCDVPIKIQLGTGLGAGCDPTKGRNAAIESEEKIARILDSNTKMVFITAGMGGGTGTGASPVIASMAKAKGILTVGVVTIPFKNEGADRYAMAMDGINELEKNVDSLLLINNEKLYDYFGEMLSHEAFPKADEILSTAVRGITEIISKPGYINVDFADIKTMMRNGGISLMGCGVGTGDTRIEDAVKNALESPLLNDYNLKTAKNFIVNITGGKNKDGLYVNDIKKINEMIAEYTGNANNFKTGLVWEEDPQWGDKVSITVIATGFKKDIPSMINPGNIIMIDSDFKYDRSQSAAVLEFGLYEETDSPTKIGYNNSDNIRKFNFEEGQRPVLDVEPGQSLGELEQTPSIRRITKRNNSNINKVY
ncbi:MAG: cell division protein FtsZ [Bacteroidetes bacterium]|uniref:Cell division protein FtsZ n=1 Tax=Candidatus Cryptobacteroides avicola TaxID=2840757 RepID=A0A940II77_9BACT|nr:cell division protein FtsZ [Candidatus Cryptobacteroides avicola]